MKRNEKENKYLTFPEVKAMFSKIDVETADQIQRRTIDYVSKFSKISKEDSVKLRNKLEKDCKLTAREAVEIINIMPKSKVELRVFTSGWKKLLPEEILDKIISVLESATRES